MASTTEVRIPTRTAADPVDPPPCEVGSPLSEFGAHPELQAAPGVAIAGHEGAARLAHSCGSAGTYSTWPTRWVGWRHVNVKLLNPESLLRMTISETPFHTYRA